MGRRSRKRTLSEPRPAAVAQPAAQRAPRAERTEAKNAAVRAELSPYAPGERPPALIAAALVAAALGLANLIAYLAGTKIEGTRPAAGGVLIFCAVMFVAAAGLWRMRYWAVLGFQALLALLVLVFALFLLRASNALAVVLCIGVIACGGFLFWKLVRVMARIQMPQRADR
ncbi:MAG TPA: hypothetical protein VFT42_01135 [Solirubrobacteraceae bacterium]|nr:hypothetical protein [Solirubrobacteraceae bacterium]